MSHRVPPGYKTFRSRRSLRLPGHDYSLPYAYHITWGTREGASLLHDELAHDVCRCLETESGRWHIEVLAYCIMPDHVHALLVPHDGANIVDFVQSVKSRSSHTFSARTGGRLWQRGFYDHILRREEDVATVARYIVENPVRAGLVDDAAAYPHARVFPPRTPS